MKFIKKHYRLMLCILVTVSGILLLSDTNDVIEIISTTFIVTGLIIAWLTTIPKYFE